MSSQTFTIRAISSLKEISAAQWDACANPMRDSISQEADSNSSEERYNPFISHAFLLALETSGAAIARTGWAPAHILVENAEGQVLAACPAYLKSHSMGEYVFDHAWADAWERAGGQYYPKLQSCVPFTPATGRRLLIGNDIDPQIAQAALIQGLRAIRDQADASSIHVTFLPKSESDAFAQAGFMERTGKQFHFINRGYRDFEGFLEQLASRKRKMIRRERKEALGPGIEIEALTGSDLTEAHWDAFYEFYIDTGSRKWGSPYLTRPFFSQISASMADRILLVMAKREGRYIAGAINFIGDDALYGRNWGCIEQHPFLHFEVCYYQAIDFALKRGLKRVEAGAQGEHKLARGYEPVTTYSVHDIANPSFAKAVAGFLKQERAQVEAEIEIYAEHVPFKKS